MKATEEVARGNEILRVLVGSGAHGMALEGTDDRDEMGIFVEPETVVFSRQPMDSYTWRTKPEGVRSGPGDTDLVLYSLRHWIDLATSGNPTVLIMLFGNDILFERMVGTQIRRKTSLIVSRRAGIKHLGYLDGQRERMVGSGSRRRVPNRPELIEKYGYDVKYASHALRLGKQGVELMQTGRLSLPMRPKDLRPCMAVKRGEVTFETALRWVDKTRAELVRALDQPSPLRDEPDMDAVREMVIHLHRFHWASQR